MSAQYLKLSYAGLWAAIAVPLGVLLTAGASAPAIVATITVAVVPPVVLLLLWREPAEIISQVIHTAESRR